ncbi:hypothetical protein ACWKSP_38690 [Micromonosporaceae bacterium Da 78-11]
MRERAVRLAVTAIASRPAGRGQSWTVEAGHWRAEGRTEKVALGRLAGNLTAFLAVYQPPVIVTFRGYTAVVSLARGDSDGGNPMIWQQRTAYPNGSVTWGHGTSTSGWEEAEAAARHDLAHRSTDWHDDASVHEAAAFLEGGERFDCGRFGPDEIYKYAVFQRAAKVAIDAGHDDLHEWATEHRAEFAVPPQDDAPGTAASQEAASGSLPAAAGTVHVVTFEGKHETCVSVFSTWEKAGKAKADWYREHTAPDELPADDEAAIEQFEQVGGDYRAWINSTDVE